MQLKTFIPLYLNLNTHPKFLKLCVLLHKISTDEKLILRAKLENLWMWAMQYYPLGIIETDSPYEIALACSWDDNPYDWIMALVDCRFLEQTGSGFKLVNWEEYGGKFISERQRDALRKQRSRGASIDTRVIPETESTETVSIQSKEIPKPTGLSTSPLILDSTDEPDDLYPIPSPIKDASDFSFENYASESSVPKLEVAVVSDGCHADTEFIRTLSESLSDLIVSLKDNQGSLSDLELFRNPPMQYGLSSAGGLRQPPLAARRSFHSTEET